jgi:transcriptional regulator with XRE-family HTH domain
MEQAYLPGTIRERIQDLLKERHITQSQLAEQIELSEAALSRFLSGATDKLGNDYITKIAVHLDVSADFIHGLSDFPERYTLLSVQIVHKIYVPLFSTHCQNGFSADSCRYSPYSCNTFSMRTP